MIEFFKTTVQETPEGTAVTKTDRVNHLSEGCWVNVVAPTEAERAWLTQDLGIVEEFVRSALDDEETSHVDFDEDTNQVLVIVDCPAVEEQADLEDPSIVQYDTHPLSMIFLRDSDLCVTVSLRMDATVAAATEGRLRGMDTDHHARMLLQFLLHISQRYLVDLRSINRQFRENERKLRSSLRNTDLMKMLGFEKSLEYFSTSLKGLDTTIQRIGYGRVVMLREDDRDLLDDVDIEVRQAIEMCDIYSSILEETMETFGSLINNNLNFTMRTLAVITLVLSMPTMVFSFYGMNTPLPLENSWIFPFILAVALSILSAIWLKFSRMMR
jgi:magnesium transporter